MKHSSFTGGKFQLPDPKAGSHNTFFSRTTSEWRTLRVMAWKLQMHTSHQQTDPLYSTVTRGQGSCLKLTAYKQNCRFPFRKQEKELKTGSCKQLSAEAANYFGNFYLCFYGFSICKTCTVLQIPQDKEIVGGFNTQNL